MRRPMFIWGCLLLACVLSVQVALAREVTVVLSDGQQIKGDLVGESDTSVTLMIAGISRTVPRDTIKEIKVNQTPAELFNERKAALEPDDVVGRYELADWAYNNGHHQIALNELNLLAKQHPDHAYSRRVALLSRVVSDAIDKQKAEEDLRQAAADRAANGTRPAQTRPDNEATVPVVDVDRPQRPVRPARPGRADRWVISEEDLLSEDQINLIRVYEIDLSEQPTVVVKPEAIDALFQHYPDDPAVPKGRNEQARFRGLRGWQQLEVIFKARAKELYNQVSVRDDPPAMLTFKRNIHRNYVIGYCGKCHGNGEAPGLLVVLDKPASNPTAYSNFLLLDRIQSANGMMIDRSRPADSLLVQYGLPREEAKSPHPAAEGWIPSFLGDWSRDPNYRNLVKWIGEDLYRPAPNYGVTWQPPVRPEETSEAASDPAERSQRGEGSE